MSRNNKIRVELTSTSLWNTEPKELIRECQKLCQTKGFLFGLQIHNMSEAEEIEQIAKLNIPLSFHAPILGPYLINLASESFDYALESLEKTAEIIRSLNQENNIAVFHGFNMTDNPIPNFNRKMHFEKSFSIVYRPELSEKDSAICIDFTNSAEYKTRQKRVIERQKEILKKYSDIKFILENDFPCYGAGNLLANNFKDYPLGICLDTSHLWASSNIFKKDFLKETEKFLQTGKIAMVHLHASKYPANTPKTEWGDGHLPLTTECEVNLKEFTNLCLSYGVRHFVIEVRYGRPSDIEKFIEYYEAWEKENE